MADEQAPESTSAGNPAAPTAPLAVSATTPSAPAPDAPASPAAGATASGVSGVLRAVDQGPRAKPWRILSIVLLVIGCVLAPIGVTASWAKNLVTNQADYLATVAPLIKNQVIIDATQVRVVNAIDDAVTNLQIADKVGDELESLGLPPKLATLATAYLATFRTDITQAVNNMVGELLNGPKVAEIWNNANADAHKKFVQIMAGQSPGELHAINVDLSAAVDKIKQKLEASGVSWAAQIPSVPVVVNIAQNADVQMIAGYYDLLVTLGTWLPIVTILLLLLSILIAPSRLGGLSKAAGWLAFSMVVLTLALLAGRAWLVSQAPIDPDVTEAFVKQLTINLRNTIRFIIVLAAVIAMLAWLFGRSKSATGVRAGVRGIADRVQDSKWRLVVRVGAGAVALILVLVLISLESPGLLWAMVLAVVAGLAALIAFSPQRDPEAVTPGAHAEVDAAEKVGLPG